MNNYGNFGIYNWKISNWIMESTDEKIIGHFLKGLFDSEGNFHTHQIRFQTVSEEVSNVSQLLSRLDIKNRLSTEKRLTTAGNRVYSISIFSMRNIGMFRKKIGFSIKRKQEKLINYMTRCEKTNYKYNLLRKNRKKLAKLYKQGYSLQYLANKFGIVSLNAISKHIKTVLKEDYVLYSQKSSLLKGRWNRCQTIQCI